MISDKDISRRELLRRAGVTALSVVTPALVAAATSAAGAVSPELHFLRRIGWGVRAGDLERLAQVGWEAYLGAQLEYETLPDPAVDTFLAKNQVLLRDVQTLRRAADDDYGKLMERAL